MVFSRMNQTALIALALAALSASCIDMKPQVAPVVRWISVSDVGGADTTTMSPPKQPRLMLGRISSSDAITDVFITRTSAFEITYADLTRWVEPPDQAVRRALEEELFRRRGFERASAGSYRTLEVEVVAFEESLQPRREAVVAIIAHVVDRDSGATVVDRRIEGRAPVDGDDPALVARGISIALESVVTELSDLMAVR